MLKKGYYYLFYKIHKFTSNLGKYDVAFSSITGLSGLQMFNIITIILSMPSLEKVFIAHYKLYILFITLFFFIINYYLFVYKDKYLEINKKFEKESKQRKIIGDFVVATYVILSFVLLFKVIG